MFDPNDTKYIVNLIEAGAKTVCLCERAPSKDLANLFKEAVECDGLSDDYILRVKEPCHKHFKGYEIVVEYIGNIDALCEKVKIAQKEKEERYIRKLVYGKDEKKEKKEKKKEKKKQEKLEKKRVLLQSAAEIVPSNAVIDLDATAPKLFQ